MLATCTLVTSASCHAADRWQVLDRPAFTKCMLEKLIWISAFMLVGVRHGCTVGEVRCMPDASVMRKRWASRTRP